jgi:hypothetical protein
MLAATLLSVFLIPACFVVVERFGLFLSKRRVAKSELITKGDAQ